MRYKNVIVFLLFALVSCQKNLELKYELTSHIYAKLSKIPDSLQTVEIDFDLEDSEILSRINTQIEKGSCLNILFFKLKIQDRFYPVKLEKKCPNDPVGAMPLIKSPEIRLSVNSKGFTLFNTEHIKNNSYISKEIEKKLGRSKDPDRFKTNIRWQINTPSDSLIKIFTQIKIGYLRVYKREAKRNFRKRIENLSLTEIDQVKAKIPFIINVLLRSFDEKNKNLVRFPKCCPPIISGH